MARIEPVFGSGGATAIDSDFDDFEPEQLAPVYSYPQVFSFSGRLSLGRYWLINSLLALLLPLLLGFFALGLRQEPMILLLASAAIILPALLLSLSLHMRRARDLGWSAGWGIAAILIPVFGLLIMLPLIVLPGKSTANRHGPANPPLSGAVQGMVWVLVALNIASALAMAAFSVGYWQPELPAVFFSL